MLSPGARLAAPVEIYGLPSGAAQVVEPDALKRLDGLLSASSTSTIGPVMTVELVLVSVTV